MSVEDLGSRRFELNIWLSFSQADLGPTSAQELLVSFFLESLKLFFFFKQKTAYEIASCLVGSEMCIRDSSIGAPTHPLVTAFTHGR